MSRKSSLSPSDVSPDRDTMEKLIGLGPRSMQKSYYPELKSRLEELTRFRNLLDNTNDLIILIDLLTGLIIDINKTTLALLDIESDQILGKPLSEFMESQEVEKIHAFFRQQQICAQIISTHFITSRKKQIPVEINCKQVHLKPNGYGVLIARNITDQEKARYEIELQRALFMQLFENSPKAISLSSDNFKVMNINSAFASLFGYALHDLSGRDINDVITPEKLKHEAAQIRQKLLAGEAVNFETRRITREGRVLDVDLLCIPIIFSGKLNGFFSIFSDLTKKIQIEQDMAKQQKLESIALLAGGIAHDFNNILAVILANISLGKMYASDNQQLQDSLHKIENASLRARDLTGQLLTFARGGEPVKKAFDLTKTLQDTASFAMTGTSSKIEFEIKDDLKPVFADQGQISQVIQNLVINADQAMPEGGVLRIKAQNIRLASDNKYSLPPGSYVLVSFKDTGIGILTSDLSRIFDPYFTTKQKGSGLGLAVTYSIIKKHKAAIHVESSLGQGTEFTIVLQSAQKAVQTSEAETAPASISAKIMLMDDEQDILEVTSEYLESMGHEVQVASDGGQALDLYSRSLKQGAPFDIIVTDLTVPGGMGGKELIRELLKKKPDLKAIVSSGYASDPVMANYRDFGFSGMIVKPYRIEDLDQLIRACLK